MNAPRPKGMLRSIAKRLPPLSAYERRIAELTIHANQLDERIRQVEATERANRGFVPSGHFYSPFPDVADLQAREAAVFGFDIAALPAIDLRIEAQWDLLGELLPLMGDLAFSTTKDEAQRAGRRYWTENPAYGDGDASVLAAMLRRLRPNRLVELGCGYSSACTLDTRERFLDSTMNVTFVDPYPELLASLVRTTDLASVTILPERTQDVSLDLIRQLGEGDVLFIDSTHVAKTDSDVNRIFFEILPAVRPGVMVHLHDVFAGFEYPPPWIYERRGWTEQYVLRAFLEFNDAFEIVLWPTFLQSCDRGRFAELLPNVTNSGGAFWFRRTK